MKKAINYCVLLQDIMSKLMKEIENIVDKAITNFVKTISDKYDIDENELLLLWNNKNEEKPIVKNSKVNKITKETKEVKEEVKEEIKDIVKTESTCQYIIKKGANEGKECGCKVKDESTMCYKHKKYEGTIPKQKKIIPASKKPLVEITNKNDNTAKSDTNIAHNILRKHKTLDKLWHSETGMVFKSAKERIVIGKCVDDKLIPLSSIDINVCMEYSFAYETQDTQNTHDTHNTQEIAKKVSEKVSEKSREPVLDDIQDEKIANKMARKITDVTNTTVVKKSIATTIRKTVSSPIPKDLDVEDVLKSIQNDCDDDLSEEDDCEEEEFEEEFFGDDDE